MKYGNLRAEIVTFLRGDSTRYQLNKAFSFSYDKVKDWENGEGRMDWGEFIDLLNHKNISISRFVTLYTSFQGDVRDGRGLFRLLTQGMTADDIAFYLDLSISRVRRVLSTFDPTVEEIFAAIHHLYGRGQLYNFVRDVVGHQLPSCEQEFRRNRAYIDLLMKDQNYDFVVTFMRINKEVLPHEKCIELVASFLKSSTASAQRYIDDLVEIQAIISNSNGYLLDQSFEPFGETLRERFLIAARTAKQHAGCLSLENSSIPFATFGYAFDFASPQALQLAREELGRSISKIRRIIREDKNEKTETVSFFLSAIDPRSAF